MPIIDANELNTRHTEFLREVRHAINNRRHAINHGDIHKAISEAQSSYAEWFAERGVTLTFPPEGAP